MRTNEEFLSGVRRRAAELEHENRARRARFIGAAAVAACFAVALPLAVLLPAAPAAPAAPMGMQASVFGGNGRLGAVVIAVIAFFLGCAVTIFCYRLRAWREAKDDNDRKQR